MYSGPAVLQTSFVGRIPDKESQYVIEVSWSAGTFLGGVKLTVACNATDASGRPLAAVLPLPFAIVAYSELM